MVRKLDNPETFTIIFLLVNTFLWFFMLISMIDQILEFLNATDYETTLLTYAVFCASVVSFSLIGAFFSYRLRRLHIIYSWIIFGALASLFPIMLRQVTIKDVIVISFLLGGAFGFGMPSCLAVFVDMFPIEKRGYISGIVFLLTNLGAVPIIIFISSLTYRTNAILFSVWRIINILILFLSGTNKDYAMLFTSKRQNPLYVIQNKSFIFYVIPWALFCLISRLSDPIVDPIYREVLGEFPLLIKPIVGGIFAFIGGFLADRIGRKKVIIYGFVSLGTAFAIVGIFPQVPFVWYLFVLINSVSAGIFWVIFILTLWGDMSEEGSEFFYALGNLPFFVTWGVMQSISIKYLLLIPVYAIFSFASFFLFLAVIPLMYAPETLPEKIIRQRELKRYIEKAKKIREKYEKQ